MTNYLADLTDAALAERLAQITVMGKNAASRVAAGDLGEHDSWVIVKGRRVPSYSVVSGLNILRSAWRETKNEINRRAAEQGSGA